MKPSADPSMFTWQRFVMPQLYEQARTVAKRRNHLPENLRVTRADSRKRTAELCGDMTKRIIDLVSRKPGLKAGQIVDILAAETPEMPTKIIYDRLSWLSRTHLRRAGKRGNSTYHIQKEAK